MTREAAAAVTTGSMRDTVEMYEAMVLTRAQSLCTKIGEVLQGTRNRAWAMDSCDVCGVFTASRWTIPKSHHDMEVRQAVNDIQAKRAEHVLHGSRHLNQMIVFMDLLKYAE